MKVIKDENHSSKIMLSDEIGVKMKYPDIKNINIIDADSAITGMNIVRNCVDMVFTKDETFERDSFTDEELEEFIDSLNSDQFKKIKEFFDTMPTLKYTTKYKCETCGEEKETTIQGLNSFFG